MFRTAADVARARKSVVMIALALVILPVAVSQQAARDGADRELRPEDLRGLVWRSIGPANMGGRVASIAVAPSDPDTYFVGYGTGGVWKTTNNGTTFSPVFDEYETASIGALAVCDAPDDWPGWDQVESESPNADREDGDEDDADRGRAKIIWVGTGEANNRNSSSWGHGVYRSTDGGERFKHLGLEDTHNIPAIAVHPDNPDICYVAAMGHLWGRNEQRGVFRTTDGGENWQRIHSIDDATGACDVILNPDDPDTIYAAMNRRLRTKWSYEGVSETGGIFRSTDGGDTWNELTDGLPQRTGRIGIDIFADDPSILVAVVESDEGGWIGDPFANRQRGGGVFRSEDGGETWTRTSSYNPRSFYFSRIRIDPHDHQRVYLLGWEIYVSDDGGKNFRAGLARVPHVDFHAMVINPDNTDHLLVGNDGGLYVSYDRGKTWDFHNHMAVGQFYNVAVDDTDPYRVGGGLQDNGSWIGPSETITEEPDDTFMGRGGAITNCDWRFVLGGDGFHVAFDPTDEHIVYAEWQGGRLMRIHLDNGAAYNLRPVAREGEPEFRFNWNAPFLVSAHEPTTLYHAGNMVFRLTDRGNHWQRISDDLTTRDLEKMLAAGSVAETYGTVVSLAESPLRQGTLWAGADDGLIHVTRDDGRTWTDVTPDVIGGRYVSKIEASHHDPDTAYVAIDGHRSDDFTPTLLMTEDGGQSWIDITGDLPDGAPPKVVREDPRHPDVLYVGTEKAAYVSIDRGQRWIRINGESLPTVAVDDLVIQQREMDLVAGTHGRSVYILDDISALSQLTQEVIESPLHAFEPMPGRPRYKLSYGGLWGDRMFIAKNPPSGAIIYYWLRDYSPEPVKIAISRDDHTYVELTGTNHPGLNRVVWDLLPDKRQRLDNPHDLPEFVPPGHYDVVIKQDKLTTKTTVEVVDAPAPVMP